MYEQNMEGNVRKGGRSIINPQMREGREIHQWQEWGGEMQ
jgi:hypothetical protein